VGKGKNQLEQGQENALDLSHCFLPRNPWTKPTGVLEHCHAREIKCWFSNLGGFSFWPHPKGDGECQLIFLYSQ